MMVKYAPVKIRSSVEVSEVIELASGIAGFEVSPTEAAAVLFQVDVEDLYRSHCDAVRWAVWDEETPINGAGPKKVKARSDYNGGQIYLIFIEGNLVFLQPHHPDGDAPIWADEVEEVAALHAASIVDERVRLELAERIASAATPPPPVLSLEDIQRYMEADASTGPDAGRVSFGGPGAARRRRR